jgi:hypothetical protein
MTNETATARPSDEPEIVLAETMRHVRYMGGREGYDMRRSPKGEKALRWSFSRLVLNLGNKRRTRQQVEVMYCVEGWWGSSGSMTSAWTALCSTFMDFERRHEFDATHGTFNKEIGERENVKAPVVWRIVVEEGSSYTTYWYCDAELPEEFRPEGWAA